MTATQQGRIVQTETRQRGFFGKLFKWTFILFNILMLVWLVGGFMSVGQAPEAVSEAEKAGRVIGAGLGAMVISSIWVFGDVILGILVLLTRGKKVITTETVA